LYYCKYILTLAGILILTIKTIKMKTTLQIKAIFGKLLFEFEKEDNTIKDTINEAVKQRADLRGAYLRGAYLQGAYLQGAYLRGADLQGADLRGAYLRDAYLRGAYLQGAYLQGADLRGAYLRGAYLQGAYLRGADLRDANKLNTLLPDGELIVWKKLQNTLICKLLIPIKAKRVNCIGSRKCRFEYAKVIAIYDGKKKVKEGIAQNNGKFIYKVGEIVTPDTFDDSPLVECSNGIHAFITRLEAEEY
jgi:Family of unknown function (DUF5758)/Pentapeptide repeats (8 copies)